MKILRLISSLRGNESMSLQLGNVIVEQLKKQNPTAIVSLRNLVQNEMPHLKEVHLTSFMTQPEKLTPTLTLAKSYSDTAINELLAADVVVIDVPMYNFTIPSSLKAWIDHIVRAGITFKYSENGVEGLVKDKQVFLAIATGGIYSDGPLQTFDHTESYLKKILGFIGITDITAFRVEGIALPEYKVNALTKAIQSVSSYNFTSL